MKAPKLTPEENQAFKKVFWSILVAKAIGIKAKSPKDLEMTDRKVKKVTKKLAGELVFAYFLIDQGLYKELLEDSLPFKGALKKLWNDADPKILANTLGHEPDEEEKQHAKVLRKLDKVYEYIYGEKING